MSLEKIRAYNAEGYQQKKFNDANDELTKTQLFANRTMGTMMPGIQMVMNGLMLAIYWIGAYLISNAQMFDKLTIFSDMIVFTQYAMQVVMSFMMLVMIFVLLPRASVSAKRINEVLDMPLSIKDGTKENGIDGKKGEVEFRNVSFCYPDAEKDVIEDISFTAHKGETIAFIGSTGCGKSTVINMIPRFYDATKGEVLVDGVNVKEYTQKALRNKIGYVSQKAVLFTGSIKSNVAYGDNGTKGFTDDVVKQAIETAQAKEFVDNKEGRLAFEIEQGGKNLSGGQKQRVAIARALASNPKVLLCDEATSALDPATTRSILELLKDINRRLGLTILLITHEMDVVKRICDCVAVISNGELIEQDTVSEVFSHPKTPLAQKFIQSTLHLDIPEDYQERLQAEPFTDCVPMLRLEFTGQSVDAPLLSETARRFNVNNNIISAQMDYAGGVKFGIMLTEMHGTQQDTQAAIAWLQEHHVKVEVLGYV